MARAHGAASDGIKNVPQKTFELHSKKSANLVNRDFFQNRKRNGVPQDDIFPQFSKPFEDQPTVSGRQYGNPMFLFGFFRGFERCGSVDNFKFFFGGNSIQEFAKRIPK